MKHFHDVLIIGTGGSGLSLALKLKKLGIENVGLISKVSVMGSHTTAAKGGINASLSSVSQDSTEWHAFDTLKSSSNLGDKERIDFMCNEAPHEIDFLINEGVNFDKLENGKIAQRRYGGQKTDFGKGDFAYRSCFVADSTGFEIMKKLHKSALSLNLSIYEFYFAFDIAENTVFTLDLKTGQFVSFGYKVVVFAGGGFSQNFLTNSSSNALTGDCHTLALKLGGELEDMEFIQFHPTGLYKKGILISEAVRAEGGILLNQKGERFMQKYSPNFMELAPRDVVARAIFNEGDGKNPCFLSLKNIPQDVIKTKLKGTLQTAKFFGGIDVLKEDIPVFPTAHYNMGGIKVNFEYKMKDGVFAIGECAGARIHGANRLGCNSLLELFTSSTLASRAIKRELNNLSQNPILDPNIDFLSKQDKISFEELCQLKFKLANIMEEKCGVLREGVKMKEALTSLTKMLKNLNSKSPIINSLIFSNAFVLFFEVKNLLVLSIEVVKSAINRKESRGSHLRVDFPVTNSNFERKN
jgi:succinate dehydrogenase/fumarate reductase flavoprotein subunit